MQGMNAGRGTYGSPARGSDIKMLTEEQESSGNHHRKRTQERTFETKELHVQRERPDEAWPAPHVSGLVWLRER